jgi:hypothetical protein
MSRLVAFAGTGVMCVALAIAASAQAEVSAPPIPGSFAFHETDTPDGRCTWGYGLQFAPLPGVSEYSWTYYDGYWNSDFDATETSAEFLAETYSTPSMYYHGITGGGGPQPCTANGNDDGGRFSQPPTIIPEYPVGQPPAGEGDVFIKARRRWAGKSAGRFRDLPCRLHRLGRHRAQVEPSANRVQGKQPARERRRQSGSAARDRVDPTSGPLSTDLQRPGGGQECRTHDVAGDLYGSLSTRQQKEVEEGHDHRNELAAVR